jgi:A/G-specific adenine glycosylase
VVSDFGGIFPADYHTLLSFKGVGPYTAAAIASFAFALPYAVVDGNVIRVLSRVFNVEKSAGLPEGKRYFAELAQLLLDKDFPGMYNQAIMDFGATICKPANPECLQCPLSTACKAFKLGKIDELPIKMPRLEKKKRNFLYLILRHQDEIWVRERTGKDIWRHLEEFFLIEVKAQKDLSEKSIAGLINALDWPIEKVRPFAEKTEQVLTHQVITAKFVLVDLTAKPLLPGDGRWMPQNTLKEIAFPRTINVFLKKSGFATPGLFDVWRK